MSATISEADANDHLELLFTPMIPTFRTANIGMFCAVARAYMDLMSILTFNAVNHVSLPNEW